MVKRITTDMCFPLSYYATNGITADCLYPLLWEAIRTLEMDIGLKVLFITCDGASPNRNVFHLHGNGDIFHCTRNPYSPTRFIYFISDVPHLLNTARNCFSNSMSHRNSHSLWRGKLISWLHVVDLYRHYCTGVYRLCPKLSENHVQLTCYGVMNVRFAAEVLNSTVANAIEDKYGDHVSETVLFIRQMNKYFDVLNVKNLGEAAQKQS